MCGFISVISSSQVFSPETLSHGLRSIRHRGPDESGIWQNEKKTVNFGHARLSIIDLVSGKQPITNRDASLVAVVNGELYDYKRIRHEMQEWGYVFKTQSDSEILLALYERYGVQCLKHLRGEFAFVLWDERNQWVFAARDRFGIKPLFYTIYKDAIYFASEAKAFGPLGVPLKWDEDSFYQGIHLLPLPDSTIFKDVKQIPPAHYLVKSLYGSSIHLQSYWDFNYPKVGERPSAINEKEAIQEFSSLLQESVKLRLEADVPVASYLSGGLDSCSLLGIAQTFTKTPIAAFTLTFSDQDYNESVQAEEMAKYVGASYQAVPISQSDLADKMEDAIWHGERFLLNGHAVAKFYLSDAVRKAGYKVVLTGEGSDEIFAGYAHFRQDQIMHGANVEASQRGVMLDALMNSNKVSQGFLLSNDPNSDLYNIKSLLGYVPGWMQGFDSQGEQVRKLLSQDLLNRLGTRNPAHYYLNTLDIAGQVADRERLDQSLYLWSKVTLPQYLLTVLGDRMEMAHSVEGRVPFLDHKLVEYVVNLPPHMKIRQLTEKYTLKEAAKPFITRTIYERQKHPFLAPPALSEQGDPKLRQLLQDTLRSADAGSVPFFSQEKIINLLDATTAGSLDNKKSTDMLFMLLASATILQKRFGLT